MASGKTLNMTEGKIEKVITEFALPIFLSQLFQQFYNSADAYIVGNFLSKQALAAVSSSSSLIMLIIGFFNGAAMGAGVVISRYFGSGDLDRVKKAIHTNIVFGLITGVVLTVVGVCLTPTLLRWMGTAEDVLPESIAYFRWYFMGALAIVMYNILKGIMNALGDSRRPLYYLIFSSLLNIALDYLFVGVLHYGVASAAIATTISQLASAVLCLVHLMKKGHVYTVEAKELKMDGPVLKEILTMGLPMGVQNSVISFANVLVQTNINSFGSDAMAACGSFSKVEGFAFLPITSFSMALTTFISQNLGAGKHDRAKAGARFGIVSAMIMAELIGLGIYLGAPWCIGFFNQDPAVVSIGVTQCHIESFFFCMLAFSHSIAGVCRGAGKAAVPMTVMLLIWCVFRIAYITVAMQISHDIRLLFWAYPITWCLSSLVFLVYYLKSDWVHGFDPKPLPQN